MIKKGELKEMHDYTRGSTKENKDALRRGSWYTMDD